MEPEDIQTIVNAVIATLEQQSINAELGFSIDSDGYLCVDTTVPST